MGKTSSNGTSGFRSRQNPDCNILLGKRSKTGLKINVYKFELHYVHPGLPLVGLYLVSQSCWKVLQAEICLRVLEMPPVFALLCSALLTHSSLGFGITCPRCHHPQSIPWEADERLQRPVHLETLMLLPCFCHLVYIGVCRVHFCHIHTQSQFFSPRLKIDQTACI